MEDHDLLIRLDQQVKTLITQVATTSTESTAKLAHIETKIDRINGSVQRHDAQIASLGGIGIDATEAKQLIVQGREMWTVYRVGKWIGVAVTSAALVQSVGIAILLINTFR